MVLPMFSRLTQTHMSILEKMANNGHVTSKGSVIDVGLTPMGMEKNLNFNRKTLGMNLGVLTHYGLLVRKAVTHGEQIWKHYAVSPIGEFVVNQNIALDPRKLAPLEIKKTIESIPLIKKHWKDLEFELVQFPWRTTHLAYSQVEYNVLLEGMPSSIVSVQITLPEINGQTALTFHKFFGLFIESKKEYQQIEKSLKEGLLFPLIPVIAMPKELLEAEHASSSNSKIFESISESLENFLVYAFYYYLIQEFESLPHAIKKIKASPVPKQEMLRQMAYYANGVLNPLGVHFIEKDYSKMEKIIEHECKHAKEIISRILKKDQELIKLIKRVEKEIIQTTKLKPQLIKQILGEITS